MPGNRCGNAFGINARTQVVGTNGHCHGFVDAFLWENGSIYNLNDLVAGPAPLHLVVAFYITDDGLIAGTGVPPGVSVDDVETLGHVFVLVPCGDGCEEDDAGTTAAKSVVRQEWLGTTATNTAAKQETGETPARIHQLFVHRRAR